MRILTHDPQSSDTTRQVLQDGPFFLRKVFSRRRGLTKVQRQTWWFPPPSPSSACAPRTQAGVETGPGVSVKDAAARRNSVRKRAVDTASRAAPCVFARVCGRALCASAALRSPSAAWAAKGAADPIEWQNPLREHSDLSSRVTPCADRQCRLHF